MDKYQMHLLTVQKIKPKFRGKTKILCKVKPHYPKQSEREYERVMRDIFRVFADLLIKRLPKIGKLFNDFSVNDVDFNTDSDDYISPKQQAEFLEEINRQFDEIYSEFIGSPELAKEIDKLDKRINQFGKLSIAEWKRQIKQTLAIDILDDVFYGDEYKRLLQEWANTNVNLITTIPKETLGQMKEIVREGYLNGSLGKDIAKQIQSTYNTSKAYAKFVARDQIAKLNADITKAQHEQAGVTEYVWSAVHDSRVRERHAELDGKRFRYNEPPIVDEKSDRRANPGEDFQCRCCALPVFDLDTISLPWEETIDKSEFEFASDKNFLGIAKNSLQNPLTNAGESGIIGSRNIENALSTYENNLSLYTQSKVGKHNVKKIMPEKAEAVISAIESRNTLHGKPNAIVISSLAHLNKRQQKLLKELKGFNSRATVKKNMVNMKDLAALTAQTGDEFAMFTRGSERLIVRGDRNQTPVSVKEARELAKQGYKWSGHTHPGVDKNGLLASDGDYLVLAEFKQAQARVYNSLGKSEPFFNN